MICHKVTMKYGSLMGSGIPGEPPPAPRTPPVQGAAAALRARHAAFRMNQGGGAHMLTEQHAQSAGQMAALMQVGGKGAALFPSLYAYCNFPV